MTGHAIHIKLDGRTSSGTFNVDRQILTVSTNYDRKTGSVLPRVAHEALAHKLLELLVREAAGSEVRGEPGASWS